jgi:MFS family permease
MASIDVAPGRHREHVTAPAARSKALLAGIAFVALVAAGFITGGSSPDESASAREVISFYDDHEAVTVVAVVLIALSVPLVLVFAAAVRGALTQAGASAARWGDAALAASALAAGGLLFAAMTGFALVDGVQNDYAPASMQAINGLSASSWVMFVPGIGALGIAIGGGILASNIVSRWVGWLALVIGLLCFVPFASFFAFLLAVVWIPVVSVKLSSATA